MLLGCKCCRMEPQIAATQFCYVKPSMIKTRLVPFNYSSLLPHFLLVEGFKSSPKYGSKSSKKWKKPHDPIYLFTVWRNNSILTNHTAKYNNQQVFLILHRLTSHQQTDAGCPQMYSALMKYMRDNRPNTWSCEEKMKMKFSGFLPAQSDV